MKKILLIGGGSIVVVLIYLMWAFILRPQDPLCNVTDRRNYTILKMDHSVEGIWGSSWSECFLYRIENIPNFEKDLFSFFQENAKSDAYVYTSYFEDDAISFSREYRIDSFSEKSSRMDNIIYGYWWRCIFSEKKKLCYIQIIKPG
ncbi:MAG: hypothetical protein K6B46_00125 [Opitutales bacterium]|nr:hypothetical protein [Opitutales bacterium]